MPTTWSCSVVKYLFFRRQSSSLARVLLFVCCVFWYVASAALGKYEEEKVSQESRSCYVVSLELCHVFATLEPQEVIWRSSVLNAIVRFFFPSGSVYDVASTRCHRPKALALAEEIVDPPRRPYYTVRLEIDRVTAGFEAQG